MTWVLRLAALTLAVTVLAGCGDSDGETSGPATTERTTTSQATSTTVTTAPAPTPTTNASTTSVAAGGRQPVAPADSDSPASGVCVDATPESSVTLTLEPDAPQPRCHKVTGAQHLVIVNSTGVATRVTIGRHDLSVAPGQRASVDEPFGSYLAPGVHHVGVSAYTGGSGPEIWLVT